MKDLVQRILKLDGVAVVNLEEPSPGDLARIYKAYVDLQKRYDIIHNQMLDSAEKEYLLDKKCNELRAEIETLRKGIG